MMPALTAARPTSGIQPAEDLVWMRPARGFESRIFRRDLEAADQLLDDWDREMAARREPACAVSEELPPGNVSLAPRRCDDPCKPLRACMTRMFSLLGLVALPVGAGLVLGSFSGDHHRLWDWGLATMVAGQTALLLGARFARPQPPNPECLP